MSVSTTISLVGHVSRDCLAHEHRRLTHIRINLRRYVTSLKATRNSLYRQYLTTRGQCSFTRHTQLRLLIRNSLMSYQEVLTTKESELRILDRGDFDLLESVDCLDGDLEDGESRNWDRMGSMSFLDVDEQNVRRAKALEELSRYNAMSQRELKQNVRRLQLDITQLQEIFRAECAIFQHLASQYNSCNKYGILQRYIAIKCIIKMASKSDL